MARAGNIFTLLQDEEPDEAVPVKASKAAKPVKAPQGPSGSAQSKAPESAKAPEKPAAASQKKPSKEKETAENSAPVAGKEQRHTKNEDKPVKNDRKSRTGRGKEVSKGGAGSHGWGNPDQDAKVEPEASWTTDEKKEVKEQEGEVKDQEENKEVTEVKEEAPKNDFITFSEFYQPKTQGEEEEDKEKVPNDEENDKKNLLSFKVGFNDRSGRRGRGERGRGGRGRGGRDRDDRRGERRDGEQRKYEQKAPNPFDDKDFPSLA